MNFLKEKNKLFFWQKEKLLNFSFAFFILLILITRVLIFFTVNLTAIDSDQPFMWAGLKDYAEGRFYEPRFYGQDYNTFFEALFAVPLVWLSLPVYYALPIATHFISLFPFLFTAFYLFSKGKKENALVVLAVLLCLPVGYDILNSIPRGFVSGLFFTSFFIVTLLDPQNLKFVLVNTIMAVTGYFVNPNSVLVSAPFLLFVFLNNYQNKKYYYASIAGFLSMVPFYFLFNYFYKVHPSYVILGLEYNMTPDFFWSILRHLDRHFAHISFFVEENSILLLFVIAVLTYTLYKQNKKAYYALFGFFGVIFLSFLSAKTEDGVVWPFYSYSRIFLGVPLVIALMAAFPSMRSKIVLTILFVVPVGFTAYKFFELKRAVNYHTRIESRWNGVHLMSLSSVMEGARFFKETCKKNEVDHLLISNAFWLCTYLNYGGPAFMDDFPSTEETEAERRYWVREGNKNKVFSRFIFLSVKYDLDKVLTGNRNFEIKRLDDYGLFLIENNRLKNSAFISLVRKCEKD